MALCHISENAQKSHFKIIVKTAFSFSNSYIELIDMGNCPTNRPILFKLG